MYKKFISILMVLAIFACTAYAHNIYIEDTPDTGAVTETAIAGSAANEAFLISEADMTALVTSGIEFTVSLTHELFAAARDAKKTVIGYLSRELSAFTHRNFNYISTPYSQLSKKFKAGTQNLDKIYEERYRPRLERLYHRTTCKSK